MTVLRTPVDLRGKEMTTIAEFDVSEGDTIPFVMSYDNPVAGRRAASR